MKARLVCLVFLLITIACGGKVVEDRGGGTGGMGQGGGGGSWMSMCPATQPQMGTPCSPEGLACQYNTQFCHFVMTCINSTWMQGGACE